jgi:hypothetical protein
MKTQLQKNLDTARAAYVEAAVRAADIDRAALAAYVDADNDVRDAYAAYAAARAAARAAAATDTH